MIIQEADNRRKTKRILFFRNVSPAVSQSDCIFVQTSTNQLGFATSFIEPEISTLVGFEDLTANVSPIEFCEISGVDLDTHAKFVREPVIDENLPNSFAHPETVEKPTNGEQQIRQVTELDKPQMPLEEWLWYLLIPPVDILTKTDGPLIWPVSFYDFQVTGIGWLMESNSRLLADEMGLGKTIQAVAAMRLLFIKGLIRRALIVAPAGLIHQWRIEITKWTNGITFITVDGSLVDRKRKWNSNAPISLVSYETLRNDFSGNIGSICDIEWDLVVLDEAQKIKNSDSKASQVCKSLKRLRSWALTGTPLENRLEDLISICDFIANEVESDEPKHIKEPRLFSRYVSGDFQLRRKKSEVYTQLPEKEIIEIPIQLGAKQKESYDNAYSESVNYLRSLGDNVTRVHAFQRILMLKQICNFCPISGESAKLEDIAEKLDSITSSGNKSLLFSQFTSVEFGTQRIASELSSFGPLQIDGSMPVGTRAAVQNTFTTDPNIKLLIISLHAGKFGLNLQSANYVFFFDRWYNPAVESQAEDRVHRIGQTKAVSIYKYICEGTYEEKIKAILDEKKALFNSVVDEQTVDLDKLLTDGELFGLFGLQPPPKRTASAISAESKRDKGIALEEFVATLLEKRGYEVMRTPISKDGGIDLIADKSDDLGVQSKFYIQCKNSAAAVGVDVVRELQGVLTEKIKGILVSPMGFSSDARAFAKAKGITLWDQSNLDELQQMS